MAMVVDYESALQFLLGRVNYETFKQMPYAEMRRNLDRLKAFLVFLGRPDLCFPIIHVAGTKGKGSTCAMIDAIVTKAGYRVGRFTSPHLHSLNERFAINGEPCPNDKLVEIVQYLESQWHKWQTQLQGPGNYGRSDAHVEASRNDTSNDGMTLQHEPTAQRELTFFEWSLLLAFEYFAREQVDLAVLETGIGGRFDATSVCEPTLCVITSISFEHVEQLGNTLAAIAGEKAGIIKPGVPIMSGVDFCDSDDPRVVIRNVAAENHAILCEKNRDFFVTTQVDSTQCDTEYFDFAWQFEGNSGQLGQLRLGLPGRHQRDNAALALACVVQLRQRGWAISDDAVRAALAELEVPCRVEQLKLKAAENQLPLTVIVDGSHNKASAEALLEAIQNLLPAQHDSNTSKGRKILLFGSTLGKDVPGMIAVLSPFFDEIWLSQYASSLRAIPVEALFATVRNACVPVQKNIVTFPTLHEAIDKLRQSAHENDLFCVTGSMYFAAEARELLLPHKVSVRNATTQNFS